MSSTAAVVTRLVTLIMTDSMLMRGSYSLPIRSALENDSSTCSRLLSSKLEATTFDNEHMVELYSVKGRGLLQLTESLSEPLRILTWDERALADARLCLDGYEIYNKQTAVNEPALYTIRTCNWGGASTSVRYLGARLLDGGDVRLTLEASLTRNAYWKRHDFGNGKDKLHSLHTVIDGASYYLEVARGGDVNLVARDSKPRSDDKHFIFKRCQAQVLQLSDDRRTNLTYSPCFWTGPQLTTDDIEKCLK
ncbi:uncharacterized protein LOC134177022 [Corticium candelabrum]|uniref:uncharacterized protein LOC134177022 n=1 Tax=Corticium candelabrum TaxID=121492 RepID=UPI002E26E65D|nr:uncharacterized protein LOC134177022 [Corticium candelabrum]